MKLLWAMMFSLLMIPLVARAEEPPWTEILAQAELTADTAQLEAGRWRGGGRDALGSFERLWNDWRLLKPTATGWASAMLEHAGGLSALIPAARCMDIDLDPVLQLSRDTVRARANAPGTLAEAISAIHNHSGQPLSADQLSALAAQTSTVPQAVAAAAAVMLWAEEQAIARRNWALRRIAPPDKLQPFFDEAVAYADWLNLTPEALTRFEQVDLRQLVLGGLVLQCAVQETTGALGPSTTKPLSSFSFTWDTPLGRIALGGDGPNQYGPAAYLLIIDTGGDDSYAAGGGTLDAAHPASVLLDLAGNDSYEATGNCAFGAGVLGYGILCDLGAGNDTYSAQKVALGAGSVGVGMLYDGGGADSYKSTTFSEGAGAFGVGLLTDMAGNDHHSCLNLAQGYGTTRGVGLLLDLAGDDSYVADDTTITNPSPQTAEHNVSLAQGAGFGRRDDGGANVAGGVGMLVDGRGNDSYSCGVFGQGTAYWYSVGFLVDLGGNDKYRGVWYVQGSDAHYAVSGLIDSSGDDEYLALICQSQGAGHDYSIGLLSDGGGDDSYQISADIGRGNANGIGIFEDLGAGKDRYQANRLAASGDARPDQLCLGLFYDGGGENTLPPGDLLAKPHSRWLRPSDDGQSRSRALGMIR